MTAPSIEPICYIHDVDLLRNIANVRSHFKLTNEDFGKACGMSASLVSQYIQFGFKTHGGHQNKNTKALKAHLDRFFTGGIPDAALNHGAARKDLFAQFGCEKCRYRMRSQAGCIKFSLTKAEINAGAYIYTLKRGEYPLSSGKRCPYAK